MRFDKGESASQFVSRLSNAFDRYVKLSEVESTSEGLWELLVKHQFIASCDSDLALFFEGKGS